MMTVYCTICVILLTVSSVITVPVSEDVDQVPPPPPPPPIKKDDGSADLRPPPPPVDDNRFSGSSISAEASVYDPSIYHGLLPGGIPAYPDPYPAGYPPPYPAPMGYAPAPGYPTPYVVQTGYEGYLIPAPPAPAVAVSDPFSFLRGLLPRSMIGWITRSMALVMGTVTMVMMGGAITTALCSLTPFCSISFKSLSFFNWNDTAKSVGKMIGNEITPERVRRTADFVRTAIRKYSELQKALNDDDSATETIET